MLSMIRVLAAASDGESRELIRKAVIDEPDMVLLPVAEERQDALSLAFKHYPDIVVTEILTVTVEERDFLKKIAGTPSRPRVVVISGFPIPEVEASYVRLGVYYFINKPFDEKSLILVIRRAADDITPPLPPACAMALLPELTVYLEAEVSNVLLQIGVPANLGGFRYLCEAVMLTAIDSGMNEGFADMLYPAVAKKYCATPERVESAIHNAISCAWDRMDVDTRRQFVKNGGKPTDKQLIELIAKRVSDAIDRACAEKQ